MAEHSGGTGSRSVKFYTINNGEFARRVEKGTEGAIERVNKNGDTVYELHFKAINGILEKATIKQSEYGEQLELELVDVDEKYVATIPVESRFFDYFASKCMNIKLNEDVKLNPYSYTKNDKKVIGMGIVQGVEDVPPVYTKESPIPLDKVPAFPTNGTEREKKAWGIKKTDFLVGVVNDFSKLLENKAPAPKAESKTAPAQNIPVTTDESDLPF